MSNEEPKPVRTGRPWLTAGLSFAAGVVATGIATVVAMRSLMIVRYESRLGLDETVSAIEKAIQDNGWASPGTMNLNQSMAKHGVEFQPRVRLIKLCKAPYAKEVLADSRHLACLLPCTMAVYEGDDGKVYVSKMNTGLMGKVFGGTVAKVMGTHVSREEEQILADIVKH